MPTRINISLTDKDAISNLHELRKHLEQSKDCRLSLAEVVNRALLFAVHRKIDIIDTLRS